MHHGFLPSSYIPHVRPKSWSRTSERRWRRRTNRSRPRSGSSGEAGGRLPKSSSGGSWILMLGWWFQWLDDGEGGCGWLRVVVWWLRVVDDICFPSGCFSPKGPQVRWNIPQQLCQLISFAKAIVLLFVEVYCSSWEWKAETSEVSWWTLHSVLRLICDKCES